MSYRRRRASEQSVGDRERRQQKVVLVFPPLIPIWVNRIWALNLWPVSKYPPQRQQDYLRALLLDARKRSGLTQRQLAEILRRPQSFVSKYESGERRLDVLELLEICRAVGEDPCSLLLKLESVS